MPRNAIVLSDDTHLFDNVRATLGADDRFIDAGDILHCDGSLAPLTNIYPMETTPTDWEGWDSGGTPMPRPEAMSALLFECRSPAWVAEVGRLLAQGLDTPVWIVDSKDTAWRADEVDPDRIVLD